MKRMVTNKQIKDLASEAIDEEIYAVADYSNDLGELVHQVDSNTDDISGKSLFIYSLEGEDDSLYFMSNQEIADGELTDAKINSLKEKILPGGIIQENNTPGKGIIEYSYKDNSNHICIMYLNLSDSQFYSYDLTANNPSQLFNVIKTKVI